ncbi:MAG: hypothetical protein VBE63_25395, partial [Lamprobacter sp.]|uniref:hypothetical protein n=1 Tax=Lamprobacter sp. TaxID=3100796 RepID=UPI002B25ED9A
AQDIVENIGAGLKNALETSRSFLGVEAGDYEYPIIRPEYLATVKIAENLTGPDVTVRLEARMSKLTDDARKLKKFADLFKSQKRIKTNCCNSNPKRNDAKRIDILVSSSDTPPVPILVCEVKLGLNKVNGLKKDIDRLIAILETYSNHGLLDQHRMYGAVVFHTMHEGVQTDEAQTTTEKYRKILENHCKSRAEKLPWLNYNVCSIKRSQLSEPVCGEEVIHDDGNVEKVFCRDQYAFIPGLILLGNANDIVAL